MQLECIPRAITHKDILCQAKSGMGKTAVFVISTLNMLEDVETNNGVQVIVFAHTRELADQIQSEYNRFTVAMPNVKTAVVIGGRNIQQDIDALKSSPAIVVGTPGRLSDLVSRKVLNLDKLKYFVVDECDHIMDSPKVRMQMQNVFIASPKEKQVMMFTATLPNHVKEICRKYMRDVSLLVILLNYLGQSVEVCSCYCENAKFVELTNSLLWSSWTRRNSLCTV